jgi:hypothetical protein
LPYIGIIKQHNWKLIGHQTCPKSVTQACTDEFADSTDLGPCPITDASLSSNAHLYLPLDVIEREVAINEPKVQTYASKEYTFKNLKEISIIPCQSELFVLFNQLNLR